MADPFASPFGADGGAADGGFDPFAAGDDAAAPPAASADVESGERPLTPHDDDGADAFGAAAFDDAGHGDDVSAAAAPAGAAALPPSPLHPHSAEPSFLGSSTFDGGVSAASSAVFGAAPQPPVGSVAAAAVLDFDDRGDDAAPAPTAAATGEEEERELLTIDDDSAGATPQLSPDQPAVDAGDGAHDTTVSILAAAPVAAPAAVLPAEEAEPRAKTRPAPTAESVPAPPVLAAAAGLGPLAPPPQPSPPTLLGASINSLTVGWAPVTGATGYYVDYEYRSGVEGEPAGLTWGGNGGRVVNDGVALLPAGTTSCRLTGLHKSAAYIVAVTAVRVRRVVLPDGTALEQSASSPPSAPGGPFETLAPGAEIARLQADNNRLTAENERIPDLEDEISHLSSELSATATALAEATAEGARLAGELEAKTQEADAAAARVAALGSELDGANEAIAHLTSELSITRGQIDALTASVAERDASLQRSSEDVEAAREAVHTKDDEVAGVQRSLAAAQAATAAREAEIAALKSELDAAHRAHADALSERDLLVTKLTGDLAKVMDELDRVQDELHTSQDYIQYIEPAAKLVMEIRAKQAAWDKEHQAIEASTGGGGIHASGAGGAKKAALRKLGPRPELTL